MCEVVDTDPYVDHSMPTHPDYDVRVGWAPSHISGPFIAKRTPALYKERKRLSMLRNPGLQNAAGIFARAYIDPSDDGWDISEAELKPFHDYMEALAGKPLSRIDKFIFKRFTPIHCFSMHYVLSRQVWKNFPKEPQLGIQEDPGDDANDRDEKYKRWRKEQREIKKGSL
ncbi:hypothetical protein QCA50_005093 [Cerrena zonata]|uniref:Uncharacterized protein n=1 Tax=Cerrena zonata TaxID=2478898 RepID=A0AAW0GDZ9_9APHY